MQLNFTKMTALGNDFIMVDGTSYSVDEIAPLATQLCDRHFGIGADGVIFVLPAETQLAQSRMRIFNSDGTEAEMCGNGIRCFAHYLKENGHFTQEVLSVETLAGTLAITQQNGDYCVDMGAPQILSNNHQTVETTHGGFSLIPISMGNPHAVIVTDTITDEQVLGAGPEIEVDALFPAKTNVEFISIHSQNQISMRVWERGCGETLACGTGACAAVVSAIHLKKTANNVNVQLLGGTLQVAWSGNLKDSVFMTGSASTVFSGTLTL